MLIYNDDAVKTIGEIRIEGNRGRGRGPKKKRMEVITEDMRACGVGEDVVRDKDGWRRKMSNR